MDPTQIQSPIASNEQLQTSSQPMEKSWSQDPSKRPKGIQSIVFSGPIPGQSFTHAPKSMPFQKPSQFPDLEDFVNFVMDQITETEHLKQLFTLAKTGISVEEFVRVILFAAFTGGQITPDVAMLAFKPLMLGVIALLHRAGIKDASVVSPHRMKNNDIDRVRMIAGLQTPKEQAPTEESSNIGFMDRNT